MSPLSPRLLAQRVRRRTLDAAWRAGVGHISSALTVADILAALYSGTLDRADPDDPSRPRFVLSKGHAALALYAVLQIIGRLSEEELFTYCADGSRLGVHPELIVPGVDVATGSLGQGLSIAAGMALGARLARLPSRTFALISDAECNEGAVWEAVMFAAHHRLAGLVAILDLNGQQAFGYTRDVLDLGPMGQKWQAFGWETREVDGHDVEGLRAAIAAPPDAAGRPRVLLARTIGGKGVSFMERQVAWHYLPLSRSQYEQACREVDETDPA